MRRVLANAQKIKDVKNISLGVNFVLFGYISLIAILEANKPRGVI
jgi:hypothetical protein